MYMAYYNKAKPILNKNAKKKRSGKISKIIIKCVSDNHSSTKELVEGSYVRSTTAYNYIIGNDGQIVCNAEDEIIGTNTGDNNSISIRVSCKSDTSLNSMVYSSLKDLCYYLSKMYIGKFKYDMLKGISGVSITGSTSLKNLQANLADYVNGKRGGGDRTNYSEQTLNHNVTEKNKSGTGGTPTNANTDGFTGIGSDGSGTTGGSTLTDQQQQYIEKNSIYNDEFSDEPVYIEWEGDKITAEEYDAKLEELLSGGDIYSINSNSSTTFNESMASMAGIFGMPYQFSKTVDPELTKSDGTSTNIGRKFNQKIFSCAPILFLTPGEPKFMAGYGKAARQKMATKLLEAMSGDDGDGLSTDDFDDGRYYSFESNFPEYKKYANTALRALALFMGIGDVKIPIPGKSDLVELKNIDVEDFMNNAFTKLFGSQCVVPFFLNAETAISESFTNSTTESVVSQTVNGFSQSAREVQFIMGSKDYGGLLGSIGSALTDVADSVVSALGDVADALTGKNLVTRLTGELTTVVSGGKIVFPEIYAGSDYDRSFDITIKLRSPDPDPVSIFLNIYMPEILLISMTSPRQLGNSSNSYESPFLVRATYRSVFNTDLGIIQSLSINKGGEGMWNGMLEPVTSDVTISIKDLYSTFFISKRMGLINNTAQLDYLSMLAGIDLNEFSVTRMVKLTSLLVSQQPRNWADDRITGIQRRLNQLTAGFLNNFADTRFLR